MLKQDSSILAGAEWVPSHGKRDDWKPKRESVTAAFARKLNDGAGKEATKFVESQRALRGLK